MNPEDLKKRTKEFALRGDVGGHQEPSQEKAVIPARLKRESRQRILDSR